MMRRFGLATVGCLTSVDPSVRQLSGGHPAECSAPRPIPTGWAIDPYDVGSWKLPGPRLHYYTEAARGPGYREPGCSIRPLYRAGAHQATEVDLLILLPVGLRPRRDEVQVAEGLQILAKDLPTPPTPKDSIAHLRYYRGSWAALTLKPEQEHPDPWRRKPLLIVLMEQCLSGEHEWLDFSVLEALLGLPEAAELVEDAMIWGHLPTRTHNPLSFINAQLASGALSHENHLALWRRLCELADDPWSMIKGSEKKASLSRGVVGSKSLE